MSGKLPLSNVLPLSANTGIDSAPDTLPGFTVQWTSEMSPVPSILSITEVSPILPLLHQSQRLPPFLLPYVRWPYPHLAILLPSPTFPLLSSKKPLCCLPVLRNERSALYPQTATHDLQYLSPARPRYSPVCQALYVTYGRVDSTASNVHTPRFLRLFLSPTLPLRTTYRALSPCRETSASTGRPLLNKSPTPLRISSLSSVVSALQSLNRLSQACVRLESIHSRL